MDRAVPNEADVQAAQPQENQQARVPRQDEDPGRSRHFVAPPQAWARSTRGEGGQEVVLLPPGGGEHLPRSARIRHTSEIRALLERGKRKRTRYVDVFLAPSPASRSRLGLIVPKHGRRIVERNRLKRRLREIGRRRVLPALAVRGSTVDVLIRARREGYEAGFDELTQEVMDAVEALW